MAWRTVYGALAAASALIIFISSNHYVEAMIGAPLFALGFMCLVVEVLLG